MLFDTHAHLTSSEYDHDRAEVLLRSRAEGLAGYVEIGSGYGFASAAAAVRLAEAEPDVWCAVGLHPHDAGQFEPAAWEALAELARHPKVVGIGECGFDFYYHHSTVPEQETAFVASIRLARELGKPLIIHERDAHEETFALLERERAFDGPGEIHCFSGDWAFAQRVLERGWYLALGGMVTFPKALDAHEVAARMPLDRLLLETDSPYLTPVPHRGKRNEPWMTRFVAERIALLRGTSSEEVIRVTGENACRLFGVRDPRPLPA